jgi:hypothetical protein
MIDLATIVREHGDAYRARYGATMLPSHHKALDAIEKCRTEDLGGHVYTCEECQKKVYSYHSCKNRHCPKCQHDDAETWIKENQDRMLPCSYFFVTFTVPRALYELFYAHQKKLYSLLFKTSAKALMDLARDPHFLGGTIGMIGVLHTWTRKKGYHPHIHYLVPAGGLSSDKTAWIPSRYSRFLIPDKPLAKRFKGLFRKALKKENYEVNVHPCVWKKNWGAKTKYVGSGENALLYLTRYMFRVALTNKQLHALHQGKVTYSSIDAKTKTTEYHTMDALKFLHQFCMHVLPKGFQKVRYYGLMNHSYRKERNIVRLILCKNTFNQRNKSHAQKEKPLTPPPTPKKEPRCPYCGGKLIWIEEIPPLTRAPPRLR